MKYRVITIEREYASGGTQVGKLAGRALGIPVYGREILEMVAQEGHTTPEYIEHLEETDTNSLLYSLVAMAKTAKGQLPEISRTDQLNLLEGRMIERLAQQGPCVIVGRCAGWVLRERDDVAERVYPRWPPGAPAPGCGGISGAGEPGGGSTAPV